MKRGEIPRDGGQMCKNRVRDRPWQWGRSVQCVTLEDKSMLERDPSESSQEKRETGKRRANACMRKIKIEIWPLGCPVKSLLVTLARQCHSGTRRAAGLVLGEYREPQNEFRFLSNVKKCLVSIHSSFCIFSFYSAFLEIPI